MTFWPFEQSWVSGEAPKEIIEGPLLTSVAVLPVDGDADMGLRLSQILLHQTALRVEPSTKFDPGMTAAQQDDDGRAAQAKAVSQDCAVDAVLFGHVAGTDTRPSHPSDWGWKAEESKRLFLYLVDHNGRLLWKDELPYTVVTGSKPPLEESVQTSLSLHFMDHIQALGLDTIGYLPKKSS